MVHNIPTASDAADDAEWQRPYRHPPPPYSMNTRNQKENYPISKTHGNKADDSTQPASWQRPIRVRNTITRTLGALRRGLSSICNCVFGDGVSRLHGQRTQNETARPSTGAWASEAGYIVVYESTYFVLRRQKCAVEQIQNTTQNNEPPHHYK